MTFKTILFEAEMNTPAPPQSATHGNFIYRGGVLWNRYICGVNAGNL